MSRPVVGLYLEPRPTDGGVFQYSRTLLEAFLSLPEERFERVVAYGRDDWRPVLEALGVRGWPIRRGVAARGLGKAWRLLGLPPGLWRRLTPAFHPVIRGLTALGADLWIFPSHDTWPYQGPIDYLYVIHDLMHRYEGRFPEAGGGRRRAWRDHLMTCACRWARGIVVDSEVGADHVVESYGVDRARIHPLPFVAASAVALDPTPGALDGLDLPERFVFYPAQFWRHKNHRHLLEAVARVEDLHLVLVGSVKNAPVDEWLVELGLVERVRVLGFVTDDTLRGLYRRATALVFPTYFGPTNIPPLEAFAHGCPVAVSDIYGMRQQLGEAALYFDPDSPAEIAAALERLWTDEDERARRIAAGRAHHEAWGLTAFADRLGRILDAVLAARPA